MKNLHYGHCIVGVALAAVLLVALGVSASTIGIVAVALACPLMMLVMMRTMMRDQSGDRDRDDRPVDGGDQVVPHEAPRADRRPDRLG
jgi:choline-glycine betaine transporter